MHEEIDKGLNLREFGSLLLRRIWLVALCVVLLGVSTFIYTKTSVTPMYEAKISAYVNNRTYKEADFVSSQDLAVAIRLASTYANIIRSDRVLEQVIEKTGIKATPEQLRGLIRAEAIEESEMFNVTVTTSNPQVSADIANTIAEIAPAEISAIIEGSSAKIIDYAKVPTKPSSPNVTKNTLIGLFLGAVIGLGIVFLEMILDTRIKGEDDLLRIMQLPVLGVIPDLSGERKKKRFLSGVFRPANGRGKR